MGGVKEIPRIILSKSRRDRKLVLETCYFLIMVGVVLFIVSLFFQWVLPFMLSIVLIVIPLVFVLYNILSIWVNDDRSIIGRWKVAIHDVESCDK